MALVEDRKRTDVATAGESNTCTCRQKDIIKEPVTTVTERVSLSTRGLINRTAPQMYFCQFIWTLRSQWPTNPGVELYGRHASCQPQHPGIHIAGYPIRISVEQAAKKAGEVCPSFASLSRKATARLNRQIMISGHHKALPPSPAGQDRDKARS